METFLNELCIYICNFLEIKDIHTLEHVNVKYNTLINKFIYRDEKNKESLLVKLIPFHEDIPDNIFDIFGGIKNYYQLPKLKNFKYMARDYIDYIKYSDVTNMISRGIDPYNRNFICFKIINNNTNITVVLFQRYTKSTSWTVASNPSGYYDWIFGSSCSYDIDIIKEFIKTKTLILKNIYNKDINAYDTFNLVN